MAASSRVIPTLVDDLLPPCASWLIACMRRRGSRCKGQRTARTKTCPKNRLAAVGAGAGFGRGGVKALTSRSINVP